MNKEKDNDAAGIEAVVTSFNQGSMIREAVESICAQTLLPQKIIIVDDGSTEEGSLHVLKDMEKKPDFPVPVMIHYQENGGVSLQSPTYGDGGMASAVRIASIRSRK